MTLRDRLIAAAARAIFDEEGPECIDDDGAEGLAVVALDAVLPLLADEIERLHADTKTRVTASRQGPKAFDFGYRDALAHASRLIRSARSAAWCPVTSGSGAACEQSGTAHARCMAAGDHICQDPSGRVCIEVDCGEQAGTWWGPLWCPVHDKKRLDRITASLESIAASFGSSS